MARCEGNSSWRDPFSTSTIGRKRIRLKSQRGTPKPRHSDIQILAFFPLLSGLRQDSARLMSWSGPHPIDSRHCKAFGTSHSNLSAVTPLSTPVTSRWHPGFLPPWKLELRARTVATEKISNLWWKRCQHLMLRELYLKQQFFMTCATKTVVKQLWKCCCHQ